MEKCKIVNIYLELKDVAIRVVSDPTDADIIVNEDGTVSITVQEPPITTAETINESFIPKGNIEADISNVLVSFGMPANIKGYRYTREAIKIIIANPEIMNTVTKGLYPEVAKVFDTVPSRVERAIRHSIEVSFDRGNVSMLKTFFNYPTESGRTKPTNSEFLSYVADHIRIKQFDNK